MQITRLNMREVKGSDTDNQYLTRLKKTVNMPYFQALPKRNRVFPRKISISPGYYSHSEIKLKNMLNIQFFW